MDYFSDLKETVTRALTEDIGDGDLTAQIISESATATARVISRESAVICGQPWVDEVAGQVDPGLLVSWDVADGDEVQTNDQLFTVSGKARSILTAERTMLNFLQSLSGTATETRRYVDLISDTDATLLDTRKTIPGLRMGQKYAVSVGGALNHRIGLFDAFLIKENHIQATGSIAAAIVRARQINPHVRVEVEVENLDQLVEAVSASPDWIMLDNFSIENLREAHNLCGSTGIKLEASGGIEDMNVLKAIAATGVDYISIGALTKHCRAIDLSMRFD